MMKHALLGASSAYRWIACPPSARLEEQQEDKTTSYAEEGTLAHRLAELKARRDVLQYILKEDYDAEFAKFAASVTDEMEEATELYCDVLIEKLNSARKTTPDAMLLLEQRLDFSNWVTEGFGTGDAVIIADGTIEVLDFKYGVGVQVSASNNPQTRLYGLGALNAFGDLYDIRTVVTTIIQPRLDSISSETMAVEQLLEWAETVVRPKAELAYDGKGEYLPGSHCKFCKAKAICRVRTEQILTIAQEDFRKPPVITDEEIPAILAQVDNIEAWAKDIKEYAYNKALGGVKWPGFKLVEGRSNRVYADEKSVAWVLESEGYKKEDIFDTKLKGITAMEKLLKKKNFDALLGEYISKPTGKPTLVAETDGRPEINSSVDDFKEEEING